MSDTRGTAEINMRAVERVFSEAFNKGNLSVVDETVSSFAVDHQHPDESDFGEHLKSVIHAMRTAFPDLHFEITQMIAEGDWVALHSAMTGVNSGPLQAPLLPPNCPLAISPTGRTVRVPHMHMIRMKDGMCVELFHLMDTFALLGQLGLLPNGPPAR